MKLYFFPVIFMCVIISCKQNSGTGANNNSKEKKIRDEVISIAENYANNQLKEAKKTIAENGMIIIGDEHKRYVIDPGKVITGLIDDDSETDAIVTITSFKGQDLDLIEHLIIINTNGKLMLLKSIESDMKILQLKDRIITAEMPTRPRSSPLYNCSSCQEIRRYQFRNGDLVRMEVNVEKSN